MMTLLFMKDRHVERRRLVSMRLGYIVFLLNAFSAVIEGCGRWAPSAERYHFIIDGSMFVLVVLGSGVAFTVIYLLVLAMMHVAVAGDRVLSNISQIDLIMLVFRVMLPSGDFGSFRLLNPVKSRLGVDSGLFQDC